MARAAAFVREAGGVEQSRVFTRMWLSLLGLWSWEEVPTLPPEQILLPPRAPLSVYSFGCWARQTIVALSVVTALEPVAPGRLRDRRAALGRRRPRRSPSDLWGKVFVLVDRAAHAYARRPVGLLRRQALRTAERWIVERQERDGSWGGIQPPWVWSIVALHALGYPLDHPVLARALDGPRQLHDRGRRGPPARGLPVAGLGHGAAVIALLDAGVDPDDPAIVRACEWLVGAGGRHARRLGGAPARARRRAASRSSSRTRTTPTSTTRRSSCSRCGAPGTTRPARRDRGLDWMLGMQSQSGGFGAFDVDNESRLAAKLAFCDFGAVTDPPSSDVTAHVLETLAYEGRAADGPATRALSTGCSASRSATAPGSAAGARTTSTAPAPSLPALAACGLADHESVAAAVGWLEQVQNPGGGFGEDLRSYRDRSWSGRGVSTASQTAWALLGLHAAGAGESTAAAERGASGSSRRSSADGGWDEPYFTGTGFPGDFYLNYHLYRDVFPVMALGRILGAAAVSGSLLVLVPLRIEQLALGERAGRWRSSGRAWARIARGSRLRGPSPTSAAAVAVAGLCAGIDPALEAGDVVCATELLGDDGTTADVAGSAVLARRAPATRPPRSRRAARVDRPDPRPGGTGTPASTALSPSTWSRPGSPPAPTADRSPSCASSPTRPAGASPTRAWRSPGRGRSGACAGSAARSPSGRTRSRRAITWHEPLPERGGGLRR